MKYTCNGAMFSIHGIMLSKYEFRWNDYFLSLGKDGYFALSPAFKTQF